MKLIHTSDWHLGQLFHGYERHAEHQAFLDWLLGQLRERESDALLIAGAPSMSRFAYKIH